MYKLKLKKLIFLKNFISKRQIFNILLVAFYLIYKKQQSRENLKQNNGYNLYLNILKHTNFYIKETFINDLNSELYFVY
jgi:hypothetical protein